MEVWHVLITLGIVAFIAEIFTSGFISGSVGFGFMLAAIGSYFGLDLVWQILIFAIGVALTYFLIRPFMMRFGYDKQSQKTNLDALIDRKAIVIEEINPENNTGRVKIDGDDWQARTTVNEVIAKGTEVKVVYIESIILYVKLIK